MHIDASDQELVAKFFCERSNTCHYLVWWIRLIVRVKIRVRAIRISVSKLLWLV